jgi:2-keto-4-pentenoate hydratase
MDEMETCEAVDIAWEAINKQVRPPISLFEAITVAQAYDVQLQILDRYLATSERLAGWKIGGNSDFGRKMFGKQAPFSGFLLERSAFENGYVFDLGALPGPALIESELCVTFAARLSGEVTREEVLGAIGSVGASYEVAVSKLGAPVDLAQLCADNAAQWGYVLGDALPFDANFDFAGVTTEGWRNGELFERAVARDKVDDQINSIIWLAQHLQMLGKAIEPGHRVLSGSCLAPAQLVPGHSWKTSFNGIASVAASFV